MKYKTEFKKLSFCVRCAIKEWKEENKEIFPDKDFDAFKQYRKMKKRACNRSVNIYSY